jgi:hypothetical protein
LNIEVFFHVFTKEETPQNKKPCARWRDAGRNATSASGDPAMVSGFRMASILSLQSRAPCPARPSAGLPLDVRQGHDFAFLPLAHDRLRKSNMFRRSNDHAKTRAKRRAYVSPKLNA